MQGGLILKGGSYMPVNTVAIDLLLQRLSPSDPYRVGGRPLVPQGSMGSESHG
jgi:hypothetical protein